MTDEQRTFLAAIRANPDDDTPRLVYADWLEEHGDPDRAAFIRVQCELEPIRNRPDHPRAAVLRAREKVLFDRHWQEWIGQLARTEFYEVKPPIFRRGIADAAVVRLNTLVKHEATLFEEHPAIKALTVHGIAGRCKKLVKCKALNRIDRLEIADWPTAEDAEVLTKAKSFGRLPELRLWVGEAVEHSLPAHLLGSNWKPAGRVELVQLYGGVTAAAPSAANAAVDDLAVRLAARWGLDRVPVVRPFDAKFPLVGNPRLGLFTGRQTDGRAVLFAVRPARVDGLGVHFPPPSESHVTRVVFDDDGRIAESDRPDPPSALPPDGAFAAWLAATYGFRPELVWLREFVTPSGLGLRLWRDELVRTFARPPQPTPAEGESDDEDQAHHGRHVWQWLHKGYYTLGWAEERYWVDRFAGRAFHL
ncbi:MAG: hypothetical protein JWO38_7814 [Gemmataceae bacterium]|nr:hypothetical protein [Gemmataceae bacterium]